MNQPNLETIDIAVSELQLLGALDKEENLTALGKRIAAFPFDPCLSKALVNSVFFKYTTISYSNVIQFFLFYIIDICFRCLDSTLTIITYLSSNVNIFSEISAADSRVIKQNYSTCSDHLAVANIFSKWCNEQNPNSIESFNHNSNTLLSQNSLTLMYSEYFFSI